MVFLFFTVHDSNIFRNLTILFFSVFISQLQWSFESRDKHIVSSRWFQDNIKWGKWHKHSPVDSSFNQKFINLIYVYMVPIDIRSKHSLFNNFNKSNKIKIPEVIGSNDIWMINDRYAKSNIHQIFREIASVSFRNILITIYLKSSINFIKFLENENNPFLRKLSEYITLVM